MKSMDANVTKIILENLPHTSAIVPNTFFIKTSVHLPVTSYTLRFFYFHVLLYVLSVISGIIFKSLVNFEKTLGLFGVACSFNLLIISGKNAKRGKQTASLNGCCAEISSDVTEKLWIIWTAKLKLLRSFCSKCMFIITCTSYQ